jgi:flagellar hook assembly protein FlgD
MSSTISAISPTSPAGIAAATSTTSANGQLTQADFLKIMVAQFTQQDPLSSGDGSGGGGSGTSDYVNQLMSMTNLTTLQTMSGQQAQQLAESLPGATVEVSANGNAAEGVVQSARVDGSTGGVFFTVGGTEYPSSDLYAINETAAQTAAQAAGASATTTTP